MVHRGRARRLPAARHPLLGLRLGVLPARGRLLPQSGLLRAASWPRCRCRARGRVWSYTDGRYRPPAPYVSDPERPWEPYTLIAVELAAERMVVLGQAVPGVTVADLAVGMEVEVVPGVLNEDAETTWTTWHWRPVGVAA